MYFCSCKNKLSNSPIHCSCDLFSAELSMQVTLEGLSLNFFPSLATPYDRFSKSTHANSFSWLLLKVPIGIDMTRCATELVQGLMENLVGHKFYSWRKKHRQAVRRLTDVQYIYGGETRCVKHSAYPDHSKLQVDVEQLFGVPPCHQSLTVCHSTPETCQSIIVRVSVKGRGGGSECFSCGDRATMECTECKVVGCDLCITTWHRHAQRRHHKTSQLSLARETHKDDSGFGNDSSDFTNLSTFDDADVLSPSVASSQTSKTQSTPETQHNPTPPFLDNSPEEPSDAQLAILAKSFGCTSFKPFQLQAVNAVDKGIDTLIIQPTGSGKSLCFTFPAVEKKGVSLCIVPTISLAQDHVTRLNQKGIGCLHLTSTMPLATINSLLQDPGIRVLLASPEWLYGANQDAHVAVLQKLVDAERLTCIAVDEAHLLFDWSSFRPEFAKCRRVKGLFFRIPVMMLTATATPELTATLADQLNEPLVIKSSMNRANIHISAKELASGSIEKFCEMARKDLREECGLIYCDYEKDVDRIFCEMQKNGSSVAAFYGNLSASDKQEALSGWQRGDIKIMVCTQAFGMGIDKKNVRCVVRYGCPPSIEAFVQEFGRAGRDGEPARAILYFGDFDWNHAAYWCRSRQDGSNQEVLIPFTNSWTFATSHMIVKCRRQHLLQHFGEDMSPSGADGCCDVCDNAAQPSSNVLPELKLLYAAMDELGAKGEKKLSEWLHGSKVRWIEECGFSELASHSECYGRGGGASALSHPVDWWRSFIRQCATGGFIHRELIVGLVNKSKPLPYVLAVASGNDLSGQPSWRASSTRRRNNESICAI